MEYESPRFGEKWTSMMKLKSHLWSLTQTSWQHIADLSTKYVQTNRNTFTWKWRDYLREFPVAKVKNLNIDACFQKATPFSEIVPSSVRNHLETGALPRSHGTKRNRNDEPSKPSKKQNLGQGKFECSKCGGPHMTKNCGRSKRKSEKKNRGKGKNGGENPRRPKLPKPSKKDRPLTKKE